MLSGIFGLIFDKYNELKKKKANMLLWQYSWKPKCEMAFSIQMRPAVSLDL